MPEETLIKAFLCSSAEWAHIIDNASSPEDAATQALKRQINDNDEHQFSVGAAISVTPIVYDPSQTYLVYSPSILADLGMHNHAAKMIEHIEKNESES